MFQKRDSVLDDSRGTSRQTVINQMEREEETESCSDGRDSINSINSDWSELLSVSRKVKYRQCNDVVEATTSTAGSNAIQSCAPPLKKTIKNIVLVLYMPKPKDWGSWHTKLPYATSIIASPSESNKGEQEKDKGEIVYELHSPYYSPVHPPEFYKDE